jgi:alpha-methylacyl-CoA racemase
VLSLVALADVLLEGFRPGVAERLGVGLVDCRALNPRLVYGRMTAWGQQGSLAGRGRTPYQLHQPDAALHAIGRAGERPPPPLNMVGDFGGGSMFLLTGVLAALWEREASGHGQVIEGAMVDGTSLLLQMMWAMRAMGTWTSQRVTTCSMGRRPSTTRTSARMAATSRLVPLSRSSYSNCWTAWPGEGPATRPK